MAEREREREQEREQEQEEVMAAERWQQLCHRHFAEVRARARWPRAGAP